MLLHRCDDAFLLDSETRGVFSYQSSPLDGDVTGPTIAPENEPVSPADNGWLPAVSLYQRNGIDRR
jgi:hypothetical protein